MPPLPVPEVTPVEPLSVDVPPPPEIEPVDMPDLAIGPGGDGTGEGPGSGSGTGPGSGSGTGGGDGSGTGTGTGAGTGPGSGAGGTVRPPDPQGMLFQPPAPRELRGREITIRLDVDAQGRVTAVQLVPPTGNARYDRELRRRAQEWTFRPARDASGRAVPYVFEYVIGI